MLIVGLALGALAVLQPDSTIPQQLVCHMSVQPLAQTLEERIVLPQDKTALPVLAEPAFFTLHDRLTTVRADTNNLAFHKCIGHST